MSLTFQIGQRVRVHDQRSDMHGLTGVIWGIHPGGKWSNDSIASGVAREDTAYLLDMDGHGRYNSRGEFLAAPAWALRPLTPPEQKVTWAECPWAPDKIREQVSA